tara:strand:+ start:705 stop:935 length:231 start_codon:yes stop_codon:yes gene_type:complete
MQLTSKKTGNSFNLSGKGAADFFYAKNAKGEFINKSDDYTINDSKNEISQLKFFLGCAGLMALCLGSFLLYLQLNY